MKKQFLFVAALALTFSCESKQETTAAPADQAETEMVETAEAETEMEAENAHANWNDFFTDFQAAVKADDFKKMEAMSNGKVFNREFMETYFEYYFEGEAKEKFLALKASDAREMDLTVEAIPDMEEEKDIKDIEEVRTISIHEVSEDGEFESAIIYYFAKIKGSFQFVSTMMAG